MTPNPTTLQKIVKARATLIIEQPFFGTLALRLKPQAKPPEWFQQHGIPRTMAVDGKTMFYDEDFVNELPLDELRTVVAHEVGHCVFDHMSRRGGREPRRWNVAGDYIINDMLVDAGFKMPQIGIQPNPAFKGMSTDQVYNLLPPAPPSPQDHCFDGDPDGGGENGSSQDAESEASEWKVATIQAASAAKMQGKLPGSLERFVDELVNPKVDWRSKLWHLATERAKDDYSWMRPNRRLASLGLFLPGLYSETFGVMVTVIDTSGSITDDVLTAFASEISAIRDHLRPSKTIVIYCDADVNHVDEFTPEDMFQVKPHGGGGTDFRPPFKWLEERGIEPAAFVYLTDLEGPQPATAPVYPVIWCCTTKKVGSFGETVHLEL